MERTNYWGRIGAGRANRRAVLARGGVLGAGLGAAALLGCGDDDKPASPTASSGSTPSSASATAGGGATPAASRTAVDLTKLSEKEFFPAVPDRPVKSWTDKDVKLGGKTVRLFNQSPALDLQTIQFGNAPAEILFPVYSRLIRLRNSEDIKSVAAGEIEADAAVKWEKPDRETMVFTLAPNIKFQDVAPVNGRAFGAVDVKYMIERGKTFPGSVAKPYFTEFIGAVDDIGNNQVRVKLAKPHPALEYLLSSRYAPLMAREIGDDADKAKTSAVGTGGFILKKITPNVGYEYEKNPNYFKTDASGRKLPYIDAYTISVVVDAATRVAQFEQGAADVISSVGPTVDIDSIYSFYKRNPKITLQKTPPLATSSLIFGHYPAPPWNDPRVRQALSMLIDRKAMSDSLYKGLAAFPPYFTYGALFDKAPDLKDMGPNYQLDVAKAKQLLSAAGFANGLEIDLHWYVVVNAEDQILLVKQMAEAAGVKFNLIKSADTVAHQAKLAAKNWTGLILRLRGVDYPDPMATLPVYLPGIATNEAEFNDPAFTALYDKQLAATSEGDRKAALKQIWDRMLDQMYDVPLPAGSAITPIGPRLKNFLHTSWGGNTGYGGGQMDSAWLA